MWSALAGAIIVEVFATLSLRASDGFRKRLWIIPVVVGYAASFYLLWVSLSLGMPVGIAYGVWTACGVALVAVIARFLFAEPLTLGDGTRNRPHRGGRAHDRAGWRRALSAPASAITTRPATGTLSRPTRRLVASAMTPTIGGEPRRSRRASATSPRSARCPAAARAG